MRLAGLPAVTEEALHAFVPGAEPGFGNAQRFRARLFDGSPVALRL